MEWVALSIISSFGQALGWAIKKRALEKCKINNTIGFISFLIAGMSLGFWHLISKEPVSLLTEKFWLASLAVVVLNVIAVWTAYRALDRAPLSILMPFTALSSLFIVPIEYVLRGVLPNLFQVGGILIVIFGAFLFVKNFSGIGLKRALGYFIITVLCFSLAPVFMGVAVTESEASIFTAAIFHLGIAFGFMPLIFLGTELSAFRVLYEGKKFKGVFLTIVMAGLILAFLENGPATVALEYAKASEVFALKRVMPFFALILGVLMFREKITLRHIFATILLVFGSVLIVWFR